MGRRLLAVWAAAALCGSGHAASCAGVQRNTDLMMCSTFVEYPLSKAAWSFERGTDPPVHPESVDAQLEDDVDLVAVPAVKHRFSVASPTCSGAIQAHFCYSAFPLCYEEDGGLPHPYCDSAALGNFSWPSEEDFVVCPPRDEEHGLQLACMRSPWGPLCTTVTDCHTPGGGNPYDLHACGILEQAVHNVTGPTAHGKGTPWRWRWHAPSCYSMTFNFTSNPGVVRYYLGPNGGNGTDAEPVARATRWKDPSPPPDDTHPKYVPYDPSADGGGPSVPRLGAGASIALVIGVIATVAGVMVAIVPSARSAVYNALCGGVQAATRRRRGFDRVPMDEGPASSGGNTPLGTRVADSEDGGTPQADWVDDGRNAELELRATRRPTVAEASAAYGEAAPPPEDDEDGQVEML